MQIARLMIFTYPSAAADNRVFSENITSGIRNNPRPEIVVGVTRRDPVP